MPYDAESLFDLPEPEIHDTVYSVSELTAEIKDLLEGSYGEVTVEGEISGWKVYSSGHAYFSLKDEDAVISCVMWRTYLARHRQVDLHDGLAVRAEGRISVYPPRGQYQLVVENLRPAGIGELQKRFEELKKRLSEEGLFDEERKRPLPFLPRRIGLVTSPTGAAIEDFRKIVHEAQLPLELVLAPCRVQGLEAPGEIAQAIKKLNRIPGLEMIVVTRGGGSLEDLWAFNEEIVARAIADSKLPVLSAVGHEIDFTISDFVSDARAPTPTGAALLLAGLYETQRNRLARLAEMLERQKRQYLDEVRKRLVTLYRSLARYHPRRVLDERRRRLDDIAEALRQRLQGRMREQRSQLREYELRMHQGIAECVTASKHRLARADERLKQGSRAFLLARRNRLERLNVTLHELDPKRILHRGFAMAEHPETGRLVTSSRNVAVGDLLRIRFAEGAAVGQIQELEDPDCDNPQKET